jgi:energy-coupling factor transporter ATP-binding protein EcfA2
MPRSHPRERISEQRTKSVSTGRGEFEAPTPFVLSPLMGRDTELSLLKDRWEQAQEGMGQVLLVVGEAGLGKSRLVQTLTQRVQAQTGEAPLTPAGESANARADQDPQVIEWRCSQHFQNSELHPVSNYLEGLLEVGHDPSPTARFDRLARHLEDYDLCRPELLTLFAKLLFLPPDERYLETGLTPAREREETFRALRQWLRAYSGKRPILLVVEDPHWIDASTLEFLGHFIEEGPHDRILMVLTFRPEFKTPWPSGCEEMRAQRCRSRWSRKSTNAPAACRCWSKSLPAWRASRRSSNQLALRRLASRRRARENCPRRCRSLCMPGSIISQAIARWPNSPPRWVASLTMSCSLLS